MGVILHNVTLSLEEKGKFQTSHISITGDPRCGRQPHTDDIINVKKVEDFITLDRRVTYRIILNETHLSYGSLPKIIHEEKWRMSKVSAYWDSQIAHSS